MGESRCSAWLLAAMFVMHCAASSWQWGVWPEKMPARRCRVPPILYQKEQLQTKVILLLSTSDFRQAVLTWWILTHGHHWHSESAQGLSKLSLASLPYQAPLPMMKPAMFMHTWTHVHVMSSKHNQHGISIDPWYLLVHVSYTCVSFILLELAKEHNSLTTQKRISVTFLRN